MEIIRPFLVSDAVDKRLAERYGEVCRSLVLDPHLQFGIGLDAYQCRIWIPRQAGNADDQRQLQLISTLFGHRAFDLMTYARKAGTEATVLLVTDDGEDVAAISEQKSLIAGLQQIRDVQGATELIGLLNDTDRLSQPPNLCNLTVKADDAGWTLHDVKIPENCAPPWWRNYRIERKGALQVLSSSKRWWRFDSAICGD
ncbi:MAG TPA: hypothetical protein VF920_15970 [Dongiaceae bacterium]